MAQICIPAPPLDEVRTIDLDVTIDGQPHRAQYRVETLHWPAEGADRLEALRSFIAERGMEWLLVQIGPPSNECIPLLFRLKPGEPQPHSSEEGR